MRLTSLAAGIAIAGFLCVGIPAAQAAPLSQTQLQSTQQTMFGPSLLEKVQWRGNWCRRWWRECRWRWGGGWRFRRCLARHGC